MTTYTIASQSFEYTDCCSYGINFLVPARFLQTKRDEKREFYCPNGHTLVFGVSTVEKQRREIERLKQQEARLIQERADEEAKRVAAEKAIHSLKRRIGKGTCPCCKRTFTNVQRHMAHKHPEIATLKVSA